MPKVLVPTVGTVDFPDTMTGAEISDAIVKFAPHLAPSTPSDTPLQQPEFAGPPEGPASLQPVYNPRSALTPAPAYRAAGRPAYRAAGRPAPPPTPAEVVEATRIEPPLKPFLGDTPNLSPMQAIGGAFRYAGGVTEGLTADALEGNRDWAMRNTWSGLRGEELLPYQKDFAELAKEDPYGAMLGATLPTIARYIPQITATKGLSAAGMPAAAALGLPMVPTPQGADWVTGLIAAGIGPVAKVGRQAAGELLAKAAGPTKLILEESLMTPGKLIPKIESRLNAIKGVSAEVARTVANGIEIMSGLGLTAAYLGAVQGVSKMFDPKDEKYVQEVEQGMVNNLAMLALALPSMAAKIEPAAYAKIRENVTREIRTRKPPAAAAPVPAPPVPPVAPVVPEAVPPTAPAAVPSATPVPAAVEPAKPSLGKLMVPKKTDVRLQDKYDRQAKMIDALTQEYGPEAGPIYQPKFSDDALNGWYGGVGRNVDRDISHLPIPIAEKLSAHMAGVLRKFRDAYFHSGSKIVGQPWRQAWFTGNWEGSGMRSGEVSNSGDKVVYLAIKNPLEVPGDRFVEVSDRLLEEARKGGHDAIIGFNLANGETIFVVKPEIIFDVPKTAERVQLKEPAPVPAIQVTRVSANAPANLPPGIILGRQTEVRGQGNKKYRAWFAWVPRSMVQASHLAPDFAKNPYYAPLTNTRDYENDPVEQAKIIEHRNNYDAQTLVSNATSVDGGTPVDAYAPTTRTIYRVAGNSRSITDSMLSPEQRTQYDEVANREPGVYGLPPKPSSEYILDRFIDNLDLSTPEGISQANRLVAEMNPVEQLVESTSSWARQDSAKVPILDIQKISMDTEPGKIRAWIADLIKREVLDRNTRSKLTGSDVEAFAYAQHLLLHAAFETPAITNFRITGASDFTEKNIVDSLVPVALAIKDKPGNESARRAIAEMLTRYADYRKRYPAMTPQRVLNQIWSQSEGFDTPPEKAARALAGAISNQFEQIELKKGGHRPDPYATRDNLNKFSESLVNTVQLYTPEGDMLGQPQTLLDKIHSICRINLGEKAMLHEDGSQYQVETGPVAPDPRVRRLRKLSQKLADYRADPATAPKPTQAEHDELTALERSFSQGFMDFFDATDARIKAEAQAMTERKTAQAAIQAKFGAVNQADLFSALELSPMAMGSTDKRGNLLLLENGLPWQKSGQDVLLPGVDWYGLRQNPKHNLALEVVALQHPTASAAPAAAGPAAGLPGEPGRGDAGRGQSTLRLPADPHTRAIAKELAETGKFDPVGKWARTPEEQWAIARAFRNPRFETSGIIAIRQGKCVGHLSLTIKSVDSTYSPILLYPETIKDWLSSLGADSHLPHHNHPSGVEIPSNPDKTVAKREAELIPGNLGAMVTDHGKFSIIHPDGTITRHIIAAEAATPDPLLADPNGPHWGMIGQEANSTAKLAELGKRLSGDHPGMVQLIFTDPRFRVRGLANCSADDLARPEFRPWLEQQARSLGARKVVAYGDPLGPEEQELAAASLLEEGYLWDYVWSATGFSSGAHGLREFTVGSNSKKLWMGKAAADQTKELYYHEPEADYSTSPALGVDFDDANIGRQGTMPVQMGRMDLVRPVEMPELVRLARQFLGHVPGLSNRGKYLGVFSHRGDQFTIKLRPSVFADSVAAAQVLAHEFGHLMDYLPHKTLSRGNLFGRIGSLVDWLATTFPISSRTPMSKVLQPADRARLRRQAEKQVGGRPPKDEEAALAAWQAEVSRVYAEKVSDECDRRKLAMLEVVREELIDLTKIWHPYDPAKVTPGFVKYRESSKELYADAISVLFNSPGYLQEQAPLFYKMFWEWIHRKPEVKDALLDIQTLLAGGKMGVLSQREKAIRNAFRKGDDLWLQLARDRRARARTWRGLWTGIRQALENQFQPMLKVSNQLTKAGTPVPWAADPRRWFEEGTFTDNDNSRFMSLIERGVLAPLAEAKLTVEDLGLFLKYQREAMGDRAGLANPGGHNPTTARAGLLKLNLDFGLERMTILRAAAQRFHDLIFAISKEAARVGAYNAETFKTVIEPNRDTYAAYAVLEHLQEHIPASIIRQIGTLKDIANPLTATLLKAITTQNLCAIQRAKNAARDRLRQMPGAITPAETHWVGNRLEARPAPPGQALFTVLKDGKRAFYYVDPYIAKIFDHADPGAIERAALILDMPFRRTFYPLWITFHPGFQVYNLFKDFFRTAQNLDFGAGPLPHYLKLANAYRRVMGAAFRRLRGVEDPLVTEATVNKAIGLPDLQYTQPEVDRDGYIHQLFERYSLVPKVEDRGPMAQAIYNALHLDSRAARAVTWPLRKVAGALQFSGNVVESLPKLAAYDLLRRQKFQPAVAADLTRNKAGTPNIRLKGQSLLLMRPLVPFWNVMVQGYKADYESATNPNTSAGWWFRWALTDGLPAVFMGLAAAGVLGAALKKLYDGVSEYRKTNYLFIPWGVTPGPNGDQVTGIQIPRHETSRLLSGLTYKMTRAVAEGKGSKLAEAFAFGESQLPTLNPYLDIGVSWMEYSQRINPRDTFRGQDVIPRKPWEAGGVHSLKPMISWTFKQTGTPWRNPLDRFFVTTDQGYRELTDAAVAEDKRIAALRDLRYPTEIQQLSIEYWGLQTRKKYLTPDQVTRYRELQTWHSAVYAPGDELMHIREPGATANPAADAIRAGMLERSRPYIRPK